MLEIELPKEIDKVENPVVLNIKPRFFVVVVVNIVICSALYFVFHKYNWISWVLFILVSLITFAGLLRINELYIESYFLKMLAFKRNKRTLTLEEVAVDPKDRTSKKRKNKATLNTTNENLNDYIIPSQNNIYSCVFKLEQLNYLNLDIEEREIIYTKFTDFINSIDHKLKFKFLYVNRKYTESEVQLYQLNNRTNDLAIEINKNIKSKMLGNNTMVMDIYLMISTKIFNKKEINEQFELLTDRLIKIYETIKISSELEHQSKLNILPKQEATNLLKQQGLDTITFYKEYFTSGDSFYRILNIEDYSDSQLDSLVSELSKVASEFSLIINPKSPRRSEFTKQVHRLQTDIEVNIYNQRKKYENKKGYDIDFISKDYQEQLDDIDYVVEKIKDKQRVFYVQVSFLLKGETLDKLRDVENNLTAVLDPQFIKLAKMNFQQEEVLRTFLPGQAYINNLNRLMLTQNLGAFIPYKTKNLSTGGCFYGINKLTNEVISLDRTMLKNGNGFILGQSGGGKSVFAKLEKLQRFLTSDDDIMIIDPEREYRTLTECLGGQTIELSPTTQNYINPLAYDGEPSDAHIEKSDTVLSFINNIMGTQELTATEKSIIDRCLKAVYQKHKQPTLVDLADELSIQLDDEASEITKAIELYTNGSLSIFAKQSNIDYQNRLICFDTKELGEQMKVTGMMLVLEEIWRRLKANQGKKRTHIIIDEIHLLFENEYLTTFITSLYKRIRKYGGVPTGITQNVKDLLDNKHAKKMLANSEFIILLSQFKDEREKLGDLFGLSEIEKQYLEDSEVGTGLIKFGNNFTIFDNQIPKDSKVYELINTNYYES